ncbi:MAG: hypothetical protein NDJ89_15725 [Oligoflexia bacterium]|nr:hypothetical protein [Oligoflexia bacterium]
MDRPTENPKKIPDLSAFLEPSHPAPLLLDHAGLSIDPELIQQARRHAGDMLGMSAKPPASSLLPPVPPPAPAGFNGNRLPAFLTLKGHILQDLEGNLTRLLSLNMSRREAVAQYLDRLAGHASGPTALSGSLDAAGGLRRWIEGPRNPAQSAALQSYFEEVALFTLGQALLLKAWSDRGIRRWSEADLKDLNWVINSAIKPFVPLDRESWQVARQNIYSWYKPSPFIQSEIWSVIGAWEIASEGPAFLLTLLSTSRQSRPMSADPQGYDSRFYQALWNQLPSFGFNPAASPGPIKRSWIGFSPTLRDGGVVRASAPHAVTWIGLEASPFHLLTAELLQLWFGLSSPPLWAIGTGLEVHTRDQLSLNLGSPKPSLLSRIAEQEACDLAFVFEERAVRAQGRNPEAQGLREQLELLPYFKKLRSPGTSLGDLQACVALTKLRPNGLLWWAREEPLSTSDGSEMLNFLLDRAKVLCEWDLSDLSHGLPGARLPLFPKYLYLFGREPKVEERLTHRPLRITLHGQIRSHVEVPIIFQDMLAAASRPAPVEPRGSWTLHVQKSPTPQREWAERWPDPACMATIRNLERLRDVSIPLASATTIRHTPEGEKTPDARPSSWHVHPGLKGFWIACESDGAEGRRLAARPLPIPGHEAQGSGYLILLPDETWVAPLSRYLESKAVHNWLDHHAERRGGRWLLNEQVIKCIPVPKALLHGLGFEGHRISAENETTARQVVEKPETAGAILPRLCWDETGDPVRAAIFIRASGELAKLQSGHASFLSVITESGKIRWGQLLKMLPASECVSVPLHSRVGIVGNLPLHMAIGRIERVKAPAPGILLATEAGFHLSLTSDSPILLDMLMEQLEGLTSPTWAELVSYLRLPRRLELAESTASDILRLHGDQCRRLRELNELLSACSLL